MKFQDPKTWTLIFQLPKMTGKRPISNLSPTLKNNTWIDMSPAPKRKKPRCEHGLYH